MAAIIQDLYKAFIEEDTPLVEINPLILTPVRVLLATDAKMVFDDNAFCYHPDLQELSEPIEDEKLEAIIKEREFSYVRMDGEIGYMVNGAGLAMTTMGVIKLYRGSPAGFLDINGSSNSIRVIEATRLLLDDKKAKVAFINIFKGITRYDDVAIGLLQAFEQIQMDISTTMRFTDINGDMGRELPCKNSRFQVARTVEEATKTAIGSLKEESI